MDLKNDFIKRFEGDISSVSEVFVPACVTIFGIPNYLTPFLSISLSFGAKAVYRKRCDSRIVLSTTDSTTIDSANLFDKAFTGGNRNLFYKISSISQNNSGIEVLTHTDVGLPDFSNGELCTLLACAKAGSCTLSPFEFLTRIGYEPKALLSLFPQNRAAFVNPSSHSYELFDFDLTAKRFVIAKIIPPHFTAKFSKEQIQAESLRVKSAALCILEKDYSELAALMATASKERFAHCRSDSLKLLYDVATLYSDSAIVLPDYSGIFAVLDDAIIDEAVLMIGDKYEKKTGARPAFYISD